MIEQNVQIVRREGERLWVRLGSQTGCSACDDGRGCGAGLFAKLFQRKPVVIELPRNGLSVEPGQMLVLALPEQLYVRLVLASYGWPLIAALAGALTAYSLAEWMQSGPFLTDVSTLAGGLLGGALVMRVIRRRQHTGLFRNCLQAMDYYPAAGAGMCSRKSTEPPGEDG